MERLAIEGGKPVRSTLLPYGHQYIDDEDVAAVTNVLKSDWLTTGPKVDEFEKRVAEYCGAKYAVAVSNGTTALHAACATAGISAGDEAITTPITFSATANAVVYCGGTPLFADIEEATLNINPDEIKKKISTKTKAILPVDFTGHPADLDTIMDIGRERKLVVIEDASHALGAEFKGRKIGNIADMTIFSFHPVKHITTGEGGMILTDNDAYYQKLKVFRNHGIVRGIKNKDPWFYDIENLGHNFRLTDIQCVLGISQLKKIDRFIARRREIVEKYNRAFSGYKEFLTPFESPDVKAVYHLYVVQLKLERLKVGREQVFKALQAENIGVNVHYIPVHLLSYYREHFGYKEGDFPLAEYYYNRAITLPVFPGMTDVDIQNVVQAIGKVIEHYRK